MGMRPCRLVSSAVVVARARRMNKQQQDGAAQAVCTAYSRTLTKLGRALVDRWYGMTQWELPEPADLALDRSDADTVKRLTDGSGAFNKDKTNGKPLLRCRAEVRGRVSGDDCEIVQGGVEHVSEPPIAGRRLGRPARRAAPPRAVLPPPASCT